MKELLYELIIEDDTDEIFAISLVESPAIESDFVYFDKEVVQFAAVDTEQRMLIGPILVPDKKILRVDGEGQPYHVFFTKDTVKKLAQNYLMKKYTDKATLEHGESIKGVDLVESWVKDGLLDKSNNYGLNLPQGSWVGLFKISDEKIWNDYVKTGKVKGFSIEGLFSHKLVQASLVDDFLMEKEITQLSEAEAEIVLSKMVAIIKKDKRFGKGERIEMESYSDYGSGISNNAQKGIDLNEKNNNKCATPVGKIRAQQLAKGEPISVETIKRMYSYLSRAETYYDETDMNACGTISYLLWGGKAALSWSRNKLRELGLLEEGEANPSIPGSSYGGETAKTKKKEKYVAPALFAEVCPPATQDIPTNLKNRQKAIYSADYGPLDPNQPNEDYWKKKAGTFGGSVEEAKKAICGNCAFFLQTKPILDCIAKGIGGDVKDEWATIEAGDLGYCEAFDFKCAAKRTCSAWVVGGPITE
jgi:hypothetical protein